MREDVVNAAGVYVESLPQVLDGHGGTFDVPSWESFAPRAVPLDHAPGLRRLPQREVARIALERVRLGADGFQKLLFVDVAGQLAVVPELGYLEIDVAAHLVGVALVHEPLGYLYHLLDVVRSLGELVRGLYMQL